jgi:hypothetical protein
MKCLRCRKSLMKWRRPHKASFVNDVHERTFFVRCEWIPELWKIHAKVSPLKDPSLRGVSSIAAIRWTDCDDAQSRHMCRYPINILYTTNSGILFAKNSICSWLPAHPGRVHSSYIRCRAASYSLFAIIPLAFSINSKKIIYSLYGYHCTIQFKGRRG